MSAVIVQQAINGIVLGSLYVLVALGLTLIADVIKRGGKDAQSIRDTLAATKAFVGVTGSVEFDKTNQNIKMDTIHYMETLPDLSWKALGWN